MRREWIGTFAFVGLVLCMLRVTETVITQDGVSSFGPALRESRTSPADLEIGGGVPPHPVAKTYYVTREDLLKLPQQTFTASDDSNFMGPTEISGVLLDSLADDFGIGSNFRMVIAICDDEYRANYPVEYMKAHHPILVLKVNGKPPSGWPKDSGGHGFDMGPYMISHAKFTPAFKILSHADEPQIPWGVVRLEFRDEEAVFRPIAPRGPAANIREVQEGYKIARQNCFRCHNNGAEGGLKSGVTWTLLAALAANSPDFFSEYVRDPKGENPKTQMPASPAYDDATMRALIAYFRTFAPMEAH